MRKRLSVEAEAAQRIARAAFPCWAFWSDRHRDELARVVAYEPGGVAWSLSEAASIRLDDPKRYSFAYVLVSNVGSPVLGSLLLSRGAVRRLQSLYYSTLRVCGSDSKVEKVVLVALGGLMRETLSLAPGGMPHNRVLSSCYLPSKISGLEHQKH